MPLPSWILPGLLVGLVILISTSLVACLLVPITIIILRELSERSERIAPLTTQAGISYLLGVLAPVTITIFSPLAQA